MDQKVLPLPDGVDMFFDLRGSERCLRITRHDGGDMLLVSVWRHNTCVGTVRLNRSEALRLLGALAGSLSESEPAQTVTRAG